MSHRSALSDLTDACNGTQHRYCILVESVLTNLRTISLTHSVQEVRCVDIIARISEAIGKIVTTRKKVHIDGKFP
jgi:hypothetical protein